MRVSSKHLRKKKKKITCNIEMSIAGGLPNFVRDDTLVDTTVGMAHRADDQAVNITNCNRRKRLGLLGFTRHRQGRLRQCGFIQGCKCSV